MTRCIRTIKPKFRRLHSKNKGVKYRKKKNCLRIKSVTGLGTSKYFLSRTFINYIGIVYLSTFAKKYHKIIIFFFLLDLSTNLWRNGRRKGFFNCPVTPEKIPQCWTELKVIDKEPYPNP